MHHEIFTLDRLKSALLAGTIAITLNTLALKAADLIQLPTAHGGLLRLFSLGFAAPLQESGISSVWSAIGAPAPNSPVFQTGFHVLVGLMMSIFYAFVLEPLMPWSATVKGLVYATGVWFMNALVVLPAAGEGLAGSANLSVAGMLWYAAAHTLFFMMLAFGFAVMKKTVVD